MISALSATQHGSGKCGGAFSASGAAAPPCRGSAGSVYRRTSAGLRAGRHPDHPAQGRRPCPPDLSRPGLAGDGRCRCARCRGRHRARFRDMPRTRFFVRDGYGSRFAGRLHHLPPATRPSGFRISLEIHTDTMSPDQPDSLTFATLSGAAALQPRRGSRGSRPRTHRHAAPPRPSCVRAGPAHPLDPSYDLWRYQKLLDGKIDWQEVAARCPQVMLALRLVSHVFADTAAARWPRRRSGRASPPGSGLAWFPCRKSPRWMAASGQARRAVQSARVVAAWFLCSPDRASLSVCRTVRHPVTVARWLARRLLAGIAVCGERQK